MKYRDLDNSYLNADVNIGSDADDEGWLFWHIVSFIVFFLPRPLSPFFVAFGLFYQLNPWNKLNSLLQRLTTEGRCIFNVIFLL